MRRAVLIGTSPRSIAISPKPPLCRSKSVTRKACSTASSDLAFFFFSGTKVRVFGNVLLARLKSCPSRLEAQHLTHSNLFRSTSAAAAECGSKVSLVSTKAQTSWRCVAAAIAASSRLVRPEQAGPQTSVRQPRGSPPIRLSISRIPLEMVSGAARLSRRDAGVTPASLGTSERRLKSASGPTCGTKAKEEPSGP